MSSGLRQEYTLSLKYISTAHVSGMNQMNATWY